MGKNRSDSLPLEEIVSIMDVRDFIRKLPQLDLPLSEGLDLLSEMLFSFQSFWRSAEDTPVRLRVPNNPKIIVTGYSTPQGFPESTETPDRPGQYLISPDSLDGFEDLLAFVNGIILSMKRYTSDLKTFSGFLEKISKLWITEEQLSAIRKSMEQELLSKADALKASKKQFARLAANTRISSKRGRDKRSRR